MRDDHLAWRTNEHWFSRVKKPDEDRRRTPFSAITFQPICTVSPICTLVHQNLASLYVSIWQWIRVDTVAGCWLIWSGLLSVLSWPGRLTILYSYRTLAWATDRRPFAFVPLVPSVRSPSHSYPVRVLRVRGHETPSACDFFPLL